MNRSALLAVLAGCTLQNAQVPDPDLDAAMFRCRVEPILVERCAFAACHGNSGRAFRLYAPGRFRFGLPGDALLGPLTDQEGLLNLRATLGFSGPSAGYEEPLIVAKPLAESDGGARHGGAEQYGGGDVFEDQHDRELAVLRVWLDGAAEDPTCTP